MRAAHIVGWFTTMRQNLNLCLLLCATWAAAQPVVLKTSTILDGKGNVLTNRSIVIENGKILRIAGAGAAASYDLSGLTVMPGWIDTHVHFAWHFDANNRLDDGRASKETPEARALYPPPRPYPPLMRRF